jgi:hypothetical protein
MNTAQAFNEDGQRILPERLYSPFIRMPVLAKTRKLPSYLTAPRKPTSPWYNAIKGALQGGKILDINTLYAAISETGTKESMQQQLSKMKRRKEVIAVGKFPHYAYRLAK